MIISLYVRDRFDISTGVRADQHAIPRDGFLPTAAVLLSFRVCRGAALAQISNRVLQAILAQGGIQIAPRFAGAVSDGVEAPFLCTLRIAKDEGFPGSCLTVYFCKIITK